MSDINLYNPNSKTSSIAATGRTATFSPIPNVPYRLLTSGTWSGSFTVERSSDNGTTWFPLTLFGAPFAAGFTGNINEVIDTETVSNVILSLNVTLSSGTLNFRFEQ